jgi:hypothetical protein
VGGYIDIDAPGSSAMADECFDLFKLDGIFTHASFICNKAWLIRPSLQKTIALIGKSGACKVTNRDDARVYLGLGFQQFDEEVKNKGVRRACVDVDSFMTGLDGH